MRKSKLEDSITHLRHDKHLGNIIAKFGPLRHRRAHSGGAFQSLAEAIIFQQLSGKAAQTILHRFIALFPHQKFPSPEDVLAIDNQQLRGAGLSGQKASYLKNLAEKFIDGTIRPKLFHQMSDADIIDHVITVKGIGEWTAHMFLMFTLHRPDVLPTGDLGIQKGFQKIFKLKRLPSPQEMEKLSRNWAGHRTVACLYLWRMQDES